MGAKSRQKRIRRQVRQQGQHSTSIAAFRHRVEDTIRREAGAEPIIVKSDDLQLPKMSDLLNEMIEPILETDPDADLDALYSLAALGWNLGVMEACGEQAAFDGLLAHADIPADEARMLRMTLGAFARFQRECYPDDHRIITDWNVTTRDGGPYLQVASTWFGDDPLPAAPNLRVHSGSTSAPA